jgi:hypothetical protein
MELSASELTKWAKLYAKSKNWRVTRMNNTPIQRRKGTIEKGWCDLIGYTDNGVFVGIEVKKIGDKLSIEQIERLKDIYASGGFSYICTENTDNEPILISWGEMKF